MQQQTYKLDFKGKNIYTGIDAHLKSWSLSINSVSDSES